MTSLKNANIVWDHSLPPKGVNMAKNRVSPFISFYGKHIQVVDLTTLCTSCYLQGFTDHPSVTEPKQTNETKIQQPIHYMDNANYSPQRVL